MLTKFCHVITVTLHESPDLLSTLFLRWANMLIYPLKVGVPYMLWYFSDTTSQGGCLCFQSWFDRTSVSFDREMLCITRHERMTCIGMGGLLRVQVSAFSWAPQFFFFCRERRYTKFSQNAAPLPPQKKVIRLGCRMRKDGLIIFVSKPVDPMASLINHKICWPKWMTRMRDFCRRDSS